MKQLGAWVWHGIDRLARGTIGLLGRVSPKLAEKCLALWENIELISYLFVGLATTIVNYVVYWAATRLAHLGVLPGTWVAWVAAVAFGYWANKTFVFHTHCADVSALLREIASFFAMRLTSLGVETLLMFLTVSVLHLPDLAMKLAINLLVILLNYVFSKKFIFKTST